jgi:hypothetical protein
VPSVYIIQRNSLGYDFFCFLLQTISQWLEFALEVVEMSSIPDSRQNVLLWKGVDGETLNHTELLGQLYQCYDDNGWRILLNDGLLSPCFVDVMSFAICTAFLMVLAPFEYNSLWKTEPIQSVMKLSFKIKMVRLFDEEPRSLGLAPVIVRFLDLISG